MLLKTRPQDTKNQSSFYKSSSPVGVTGHLEKIEGEKRERERQKQLEKKRIIADKTHRLKAELCQGRLIRRAVINACVKAITEPEIEVRVTFDNADEASYAVEQIPKTILRLDLSDKAKTTASAQNSWPTIELRNGSAIIFILAPKGTLQTT